MGNNNQSIVGVWYVRVLGAPFEYHVFTFHADGTMLQANPDAGDAGTSDSIGMGTWLMDGDIVRAKFVENTAHRETHAFASRGEIALEMKIHDDMLIGYASATFYDAENKVIKGPTREKLKGTRVSVNMSTPITNLV